MADRPAFLSAFLADFYNVDVLGGKRISDQVVQYGWNVAAGASGGPYGVIWTHAEQVNPGLVNFLE